MFCVLVEGPLDAARIGPPAIALLGKVPSSMQVSRLITFFGQFVLVPDNDKNISRERRILDQERLERAFCTIPRRFQIMNPWPGVKDAGDWSPDQAQEFLALLERKFQ